MQNLDNNLVDLFIENLHEFEEKDLLRLNCFVEYELRERDVDWAKKYAPEFKEV